MVSMTNKIIWFKVSLLAFFLAVGCAPKPKKAETKLNLVSSMAVADINMDGGAVVYGQQQNGPGSWAKIFRPGEDVVVDMAYGVWNFSVIAYAGPTQLSGTIECAILNKVDIADDNVVIDVVISSGQCSFAGIRNLQIKRCSQTEFDSADPMTNCSQVTGIESYRLQLLSHRLGKNTGDFLESQCYTETTFGGAGSPKVPMGVTNIQKQPFALIGYTGTACNPGTENYVLFEEALSIPSNKSIKAFQSGANVILALNNDGPGLDTIAPIVSFPAAGSSAVIANGRNWINQSNAASFNIGGSCEVGVPVNLYLNGTQISGGIGPGSVTCTSSIWGATLNLSGLPDSAYGAGYTIEARQTDGGGNVGSASVVFDKDASAPSPGAILSVSPTPLNVNYINDNTPDISITKGTDGSGSGSNIYTLKIYALASCGGGFSTQNITEPAGTFTTGVLGNGTYSFRVTTTDFAGNTSVDSVCYGTDIIVDTAPPLAATAVQLNSGGTLTFDNTPDASWTSSVSGDVNAYEVELYNAGCGTLQSTLTGIGSGATSYTLPSLVDAFTASVKVVAVDMAGNKTSSACTNNTIIDLSIPTNASSISFSGTPSGTLTSTAQITVNFAPGTDGSGIAQQTVRFYDGGTCSNLKDTIVVGGGVSTATTTALSGTADDGFYKVQIEVQDNAGNTNTSPCSTATIQRDTTPPSPSTGITWDIGATVYIPRMDSGTWTHDTGGGATQVDLNLYNGSGCSGTVVYSNTAQPTTYTDFIFDVATEGTYSYGVITRDAAGNNSTEACSSDINFIQTEMGLGTRFWDAEVFSPTRIYFVTHSGIAEIYDSSAFPNFEKQGAFKVNGFKADAIINFNSNYALLYDKSTGDMHAWKYTTPGTIDDPQYIGQINTGTTSIKDHAQSGTTLFLLDGSDNLHGIDLTNVSAPAIDFVSFSVGSGCNTIEVDSNQNYLYAGCGSLLKPVDISGTPTGAIPAHDPASTMVFDHLSFNPNNNTLYGAGNGIGGSVAAIDTSTPANPETAGGELTGTGNILSLGNFDGTDGVICIDGSPDEALRLDVSGAPTLRNRLDTKSGNKCEKALVTTNHTLSVSVNGAAVRSATGGPGPLVVDNAYMDGGTAFKITHDIDPTGTDYAAVGLLTGGISILNTSNKRTPYQVAHITGSNRAVSAGTGNILYAVDGINFRKYDMSTISTPSPAGSVSLNAFGPTYSPENQAPMILNPSGPGYAYVGGRDGVVAIVDTGSPSLVSKVVACSGTVGNHVRGLNFINNILVVACLDGDIFTYNLSTPASPVLADSITATKNLSGANQEAVGLARADNFFYTALEDNGIDIFQVNGTDGSITDHPDFDPTERIVSLFRPGTESFMYAATANSVIKINMASSTSLSVIQTVSTPTVPYELVPAQDIGLDSPSFLYMATGYGGVQVIDSSRSDALFQ